MSVHYKFKSALDYDTITFDGLHISVKDLKKSILHQKKIGKTNDFDLQVTNAQTKEVYTDDNVLIAKNTSLIIARIPVSQSQKKSWDFGSQPNASGAVTISSARPTENEASADLSKMAGSEEDKIKAMISQSTLDYDPSNYQKVRGSNQTGEVPPNYRCYKCHMAGHWIKNCPMSSLGPDSTDIKRSTGIPRSFMVDKPAGGYGQPAESTPSPEPIRQMNFAEPKVDIPDDLQCMICKDLLTDAVMIPCCGSSFCDECIRMTLMESEDHECPDCKDKDISPVTLIPNRFLRNSVIAFKTETGYIKTRKYIPKTVKLVVDASPTTLTPSTATVDVDNNNGNDDKSVVILDSTLEVKESVEDDPEIDTTVKDEDSKNEDAKSTVISEADSTQNGKSKENKEADLKEVKIEEKPVVEPAEETAVTEPLLETDRPPGVEMESDGDYEDNITVTMPPPHMQGRGALRNGRHLRPFLRPPGVETPPHQRGGPARVSPPSANEDRAGTPTIDEKQPQRPSPIAPEGQYNIPSMIDYPPQAGMPQVPMGGVPPHMMHGPPPVQGPPMYGGPPPPAQVIPQDPYGRPTLVPPQPGQYPPNAVPPYAGPPPEANRPDYNPHMNAYIPPQYDNRAMNPGMPPGYDRSRGGGGMFRGGPVPGGYPPMGGPRPINPQYPGPPRRMGGPEVVDKALEAFNRMMREKDEQARRREDRDRRRDERDRMRRTRSRSRSSTYSRGSSLISRRSRSRSRSRSYARINYSRSRSRSPSRPKMRKLSRSPMRRSRTPRRRSRTRSKSFSISRSRSFSRSMSPRGEYSPRRNHPRYRSPMRTPPRYIPHKDNHMRGSRHRDFGPPHHHPQHHPNDHYPQRTPPPRGDFYNQNEQGLTGGGPPPYHRHGTRGGGRGGRGGFSHHHHNQNQNRPDYYNNDGQIGQGYGRYNRDKRGSPSRSSYPPPLMSLKPSGPSMGASNAPPMYNEPQRYENIPSIQQPAPYNVRPGRYDTREELPPPGTEQPPPPGFEPAPRYRDETNRYQEQPGSEFRPSAGYPGEDYRMAEQPEPAAQDYHEQPVRESGRNRKDEPSRSDQVQKESSRHDSSKDTRDHHQSRSRHRVTPSPENRSRDRNPSGDRYKKRSAGSKDESSGSRHMTMTPKKERDSGKKEPESKSTKKDPISEEEKAKERKAKEEKREKKKKKKDAEKKKRKEEKKREKEEKSKSKKEAKDAASVGGVIESNADKESVPIDDAIKDDKAVSDKDTPADISMESLDDFKDNENKLALVEEALCSTPKPDLYGDILIEGGIDSKVVENYGKLNETPKQSDTSKDSDKDGSFDGLELQASEQDLKSEFDESSPKKLSTTISTTSSNTVLANLPEPSKWELDDPETSTPGRGDTIKDDDATSPLDKSGGSGSKIVTNEVLKRAENAIFAKAINAIRPIEIKKISTDRAKLYSGITDKLEMSAKDSGDKKTSLTPDKKNLLQVTIPSDSSESRTVEMNEGGGSSQRKSLRTKITGPGSPPSRLSVRERLGGKVEEGAVLVGVVSLAKRSRTRTPPRAVVEAVKRGVDVGGGGREREKERRDREERAGRNDRSGGGGGGRLDSKVKSQDYQVSRPDRSREDVHRSSSAHQQQQQHRSTTNTDQHQRRSRDRQPAAQYSQQQQQHSSQRNSSRYEHHHQQQQNQHHNQQQASRQSSRNDQQQSTKRGNNQQQRRRSRSNSSEDRRRVSKRDKKHKREKESTSNISTTNIARKREDFSSKTDPIAKFMNAEAPVPRSTNTHKGHDSQYNTEKSSKIKQQHHEGASSTNKRTTLDEASFEPDYDETFETETEEDKLKKRTNTSAPAVVTEGLTKAKKRSRTPDSSSSSEDSSSDDSSSDGSSDRKKKNKKKKRKKRKASSRRKSTSSESESEDGHDVGGNMNESGKKKRKHKRNKQAKKKKKSKHK